MTKEQREYMRWLRENHFNIWYKYVQYMEIYLEIKRKQEQELEKNNNINNKITINDNKKKHTNK